MNNPVFLDTCIFFEIHENDSKRHSFIHLNNLGRSLATSLTVIGEFIQELTPLKEKDAYLNTFWDFIEDVDLLLLLPNSRVSYACYLICKYNEDDRMRAEYTDLVHLAYALAYDIPLFITTDRHLSHYRIPPSLLQRGYKQPTMMDISTLERQLLQKKG